MQREVTALELAAARGHVNVLSLLLSRLSAMGLLALSAYQSALHLAVIYGHPGCVDVLCMLSMADVNERDEHGQSALHWAVQSANTQIVLTLMQHGARYHADGDGHTPLHIAAHRCQIELLVLMIDDLYVRFFRRVRGPWHQFLQVSSHHAIS